jgi:hypothetical protein
MDESVLTKSDTEDKNCIWISIQAAVICRGNEVSKPTNVGRLCASGEQDSFGLPLGGMTERQKENQPLPLLYPFVMLPGGRSQSILLAIIAVDK